MKTDKAYVLLDKIRLDLKSYYDCGPESKECKKTASCIKKLGSLSKKELSEFLYNFHEFGSGDYDIYKEKD